MDEPIQHEAIARLRALGGKLASMTDAEIMETGLYQISVAGTKATKAGIAAAAAMTPEEREQRMLKNSAPYRLKKFTTR